MADEQGQGTDLGAVTEREARGAELTPEQVEQQRASTYRGLNAQFRRLSIAFDGQSDISDQLKGVSHEEALVGLDLEGKPEFYKHAVYFLTAVGVMNPQKRVQDLRTDIRAKEKELDRVVDALGVKLYGADPNQIGGLLARRQEVHKQMIALCDNWQAIVDLKKSREADVQRYETELASISPNGKSASGRTYAAVNQDYLRAVRDAENLPGDIEKRQSEYERAERRFDEFNVQIQEVKGVRAWSRVMLSDVRAYSAHLGNFAEDVVVAEVKAIMGIQGAVSGKKGLVERVVRQMGEVDAKRADLYAGANGGVARPEGGLAKPQARFGQYLEAGQRLDDSVAERMTKFRENPYQRA